MRPEVKKSVEVDWFPVSSWQESFNSLVLSFLTHPIIELISEVQLFRYATHVSSSGSGNTGDNDKSYTTSVNKCNIDAVKNRSLYIAGCIGEQISIITHPHAYVLPSSPAPTSSQSQSRGVLPSNNISPVWLQRTWSRLALPLLKDLTSTNNSNNSNICENINGNSSINENSNNSNSQSEEVRTPCLLAVCALANTLSATILLPHSTVLAKVQICKDVFKFIYVCALSSILFYFSKEKWW